MTEEDVLFFSVSAAHVVGLVITHKGSLASEKKKKTM